MQKGPLAGYEIVGVKMCLDDGSYHDVDSSDLAFRVCAIEAFKQAFHRAKPCLQEPVMKVEVETPIEHQGPIVGDLNSRRGLIMESENRDHTTVIRAEVPLANLFGYATIVRSLSKGMATFTMEMSRYARVPTRLADEIIAVHRQAREAEARK
jgi:elongation factor G